MKRTTKQLVALVLSFVMVLGVCPLNVFAAPQKNTAANIVTSEQNQISYDFGADAYDFSAVNAAIMMMGAENIEIDEEDPAIMAMEEDLDNIVVAEEGSDEPVLLTEEQKMTILGMYQQYLDFWKSNADVLGVQAPFFLAYNDNNEDGLGVLGEMFALAGWTVDEARNGERSYDDITGMIMNFMFGDQLGVKYYADAIKTARDEVLQAINDSGAKTEEQKLLVINDWLAHNCTFDMPYIMNAGKADDEKPMVPENPVKPEHYDDVYNVIYAEYEKQIHDQFYGQIYAGIEAAFRQQFYEGAIRQGVYDAVMKEATAAAYQKAYAGVEAAMKEQVYAQAQQAAYDEVYKAAVNEYVANNEGATAESEEAIAAGKAAAEAYVATDDAKAQFEAAAADYVASEDGKAQIDTIANQEIAKEEVVAELEAVANEEADKFMAENAEAIAADAPAFVLGAFGEEAAAQIAEQCELFIEDAKTNGVEVDPVNAPGYKMTIAQLADAQMDEPLEDLQGMTPNQAIPVYADQAALGLTEGVLNYWEGHHIGALGTGKAVCFGYSKAFTYLVQVMHPEIYGVNGADTDMTVASNWKEAKDIYYNAEGELDINNNYAVDMVRITFDAAVTMYGEVQPNFNSDHFWNAVKVNGEWYYVDPCYMDVFVQTMNRDRAQADGAMSYLYFLFSHTTAVELYDGYFKEGGIKTLYANAATSQIYEDSWFSRIASNTYSDGENFYYVYDSTDLITLMQESEGMGMNNNQEDLDNPAEIKLVYHPITTTDASSNGDTDYTTLIDFNHRETEGDEEPEDVAPTALVLNPETGDFEENELLTKLIRQHEEEAKAYPSIKITTGLYDGKLYFNLSNCILSYELATGVVELVKEYNTVYAKRDKTNGFGGSAFTVVKDASEADLMVENNPIAAMTIKADGNMYVSVATNYAFISGKDPHNSADQGSYGYEFEETNYNKDYNSYIDYTGYEDMADSMGYEKEINDNDEFMWSTNFVETLPMSHLAGTSHSFEEVTVDAHCGRNAYTENRCTACGISEEGTRAEVEDSAYGHHYLRHEETYYTKDENGNWNTGVAYVCTECKKALEVEADSEIEDEIAQLEDELAENDHIGGHEYVGVVTDWADDYSSATMDVMCVRCVDATLDILVEDETIELAEDVKSTEVLKERVVVTKVVVDEETGEETEEKSYYWDYTAVATVKDPSGNEITVHSVPAERVSREPDKYDRNPFPDVDSSRYSYDAILWAFDNGITTGDDGYFRPFDTCTREEVVTFLWRTMGKPEPTSAEKAFPDVKDNYALKAIAWAAENGITTGDDGYFRPEDTCTREEVMTFIWRTAGKPAATSDELPFTDVKDNYAREAITWAAEKGITTGDDGYFRPEDTCTREEIVTFLFRQFGTPVEK